MNWNCTTTEERLTDYLDGALPRDEAAALSTHVAGCAACANMVSRVSALVSGMQKIQPLDVPVHLNSRILDATLGPRTQARDWRRWFDWAAILWQPRFAMGVATVATTAAVLFHAFAPMGKKITLADLSPFSIVRSANRQVHLTYAHGVKFVNDLRVVYEIESRLGPQPAMSNPVPQPETPPSNDPHQKTQAVPHSNRREADGEGLLAFAMAEHWPDESTTRSLP